MRQAQPVVPTTLPGTLHATRQRCGSLAAKTAHSRTVMWKAIHNIIKESVRNASCVRKWPPENSVRRWRPCPHGSASTSRRRHWIGLPEQIIKTYICKEHGMYLRKQSGSKPEKSTCGNNGATSLTGRRLSHCYNNTKRVGKRYTLIKANISSEGYLCRTNRVNSCYSQGACRVLPCTFHWIQTSWRQRMRWMRSPECGTVGTRSQRPPAWGQRPHPLQVGGVQPRKYGDTQLALALWRRACGKGGGIVAWSTRGLSLHHFNPIL